MTPTTTSTSTPTRTSSVLALVLLGLLVGPPVASAHGRGPVLALDYRLRLAPAPAGTRAAILDGDRSLELRVDPGTSLIVRGLLGEPMLRFGRDGVFANAASPTAQADRIISAGTGWRRVAGGAAYHWHDHRLAPSGARGSFAIPVVVDGMPATVEGEFVRVARPALWPWLAGGVLLGAAIALTAMRRALRIELTVVLGVAAGIAALTATVAFALRDRPSGGVAALPLAATAAVALALGIPLLRLRGTRRAHIAGVTGAVAAAVTIAALPVFWHGVVISALGADLVRSLCGIALVGGAAAAVVSLLPEVE